MMEQELHNNNNNSKTNKQQQPVKRPPSTRHMRTARDPSLFPFVQQKHKRNRRIR